MTDPGPHPQSVSTSNIIFPLVSSSLFNTLKTLKRNSSSISWRLQSIYEDSLFVSAVADAYNLPLIANERCGSWYIHPQRKAESAYFKSTDGHAGQWSFSLRRLNVQVLDVIERSDGCIIVDSTRRGKGMPDALSKTIPIWCAVMNRILFPGLPNAGKLHTPPQTISGSEHAQIEDRLNYFVQQVMGLNLSLTDFRAKLSKPLRPLWVTQESTLLEIPPEFPNFHPVVLCTASRRVSGSEMIENGYVQGAGDDSESWAHGLTPSLFWENRDVLMSTLDDDIYGIIKGLLLGKRNCSVPMQTSLIKPTESIFVGPLEVVDKIEQTLFDAIICCSPSADDRARANFKEKYLHLKCAPGKLGSRNLRMQLPNIVPFIEVQQSTRRILICCPTGNDIALGVALTIICLFSDDEGNILPKVINRSMTKPFIRQRLGWIAMSLPNANPSRATLQSVNAFLMS